MDTLGWLVVIALLWVFGRHSQLTASLSLGAQNQVPTSSDNLPIISDQNTQNPPSNQPAPWSRVCNRVTFNPVASVGSLPLAVSNVRRTLGLPTR